MKLTTKRLLTLDSLRGLMLVGLAFDHYGGPLKTITYEPLGFVSAAEGFVFLAGLMLGILYIQRMSTAPRETAEKLLSRTFKIYLAYVAVLLFFIAVLHFFPGYAPVWQDRLPPGFTASWETVLGSALLVYQVDLLGILALYTLLFLAAPALLWLFAKGHALTVLCVSALLYLVQPLGMDQLLARVFPYSNYNIFTWGFLFVTGIYLGYRYRSGTLRVSFQLKYLVPVIVLTAAIFVARELFRFGLLGDYGYWVKLAFTREYLSPLRLLDFFMLVYLLAGLSQVRPQWLKSSWLTFLGQHSLYVFAYHAPVLYLLDPVRSSLDPILGSLLFVASLTIPAALHYVWRERHTRSLVLEPLPR